MEQLSSTATMVESRVQQDGNAITSRSPGTTMEFSVALVAQLFGKDKADSVKGPLVMRSNSGDEYTIVVLNTVERVSDDPPKISRRQGLAGFVSLHWLRLNNLLTHKSQPKFAEVASLEFLMFPRDDKVSAQYARKIVMSCYFDMKD